jgi:tRNA A-37 threonylcarbamoyl transferase component Bud32
MDPLFDRFREHLLPRYELQAELGRGGMGIVYRARDTVLRRTVAVKLLRPGMETALLLQGFRREAQVLARINVPQVVTVFDVPPAEDGLYYFVMEYVPHETLMARLRRGPLGTTETIRLGHDLLTGLVAIHREGVVHRDIKPSNIFVGPDRGVIGDFGIARLAEETGSSLGSDDPNQGTRLYMASEQLAGEPATTRTDIYQVGAVLYEARTGRRWSDVAGQPPRLIWQGVSRPLAMALRQALQEDPGDRWPDALAFRRALERVRSLPAWLLFAAVVVAVLIGVPIAISGRTPPMPEPRVQLTLLRFTGPDTALATTLTTFVGDPLERFEPITTRPVTLSLSYPAPHDTRGMKWLNTAYFVRGSLEADSLASVTVNDAGGHAIRSIRVRRDGFDRLHFGRAIADSLVRSLYPALYDEYRGVTGSGGSDNANVVGLYLRCEAAFQRDAYRVAERQCDSALSADPGFAQASWLRGMIRRWRRNFSLEDLDLLARRDSNLLDERFQALLGAQREPDLSRRFARYRDVIARYPHLGQARLLYADEVFHRSALVGYPLDSGLAAMRAAIAADSAQDQAPAVDHLIWGYIHLGLRDSASAALQYRERIAEAHEAPGYEEGAQRTRFLQVAYDERFNPWWGWVKRHWLTFHPSNRIVSAVAEYVQLGNSFDIPATQRALGRMLVREGNRDSVVGEGYEAQGLALITLGRPREALAMFDSAAVYFETAASLLETAEWRVLPLALGLPAAVDSERFRGEKLLDSLARDSLLAPRAIWARAMGAVLQGDTLLARSLTARLNLNSPPGSATGRLRRLLVAFDSAAGGNFDAALRTSAPLLAYDPAVRSGDPFARAVLYLARADWFSRLRRFEEAETALRWHQNADIDGWGQGEAQEGMVDAALSAVARVREGRSQPTRSRVAAGCADLRRVRELWRDAEPGPWPERDSLATELGRCR